MPRAPSRGPELSFPQQTSPADSRQGPRAARESVSSEVAAGRHGAAPLRLRVRRRPAQLTQGRWPLYGRKGARLGLGAPLGITPLVSHSRALGAVGLGSPPLPEASGSVWAALGRHVLGGEGDAESAVLGLGAAPFREGPCTPRPASKIGLRLSHSLGPAHSRGFDPVRRPRALGELAQYVVRPASQRPPHETAPFSRVGLLAPAVDRGLNVLTGCPHWAQGYPD